MVRTELQVTDDILDVLANIIIKYHLKLKRRRIFFFIFGIVSIGLATVFYLSKELLLLSFFSFYAVFMIYWSTIGLKNQTIRNVKKVNKKANISKRFYIFHEDGIEIRSSIGESRTNWSGFTNWGEYEHYIFAIRKDNQVILADKSNLSPEEIEEVTALLTANVKKKEQG